MLDMKTDEATLVSLREFASSATSGDINRRTDQVKQVICFSEDRTVDMIHPHIFDIPQSSHGAPYTEIFSAEKRNVRSDTITQFSGCKIIGKDFSVLFDKTKTAVAESTPHYSKNKIYKVTPNENIRKLVGEYVRAAVYNHRNYFHWHVNVLPNIFLCQAARLRGVKYIVPEMSAWQGSSLTFLGATRGQQVTVKRHEVVEMDDLFMGSPSGRNALQSSDVILKTAQQIVDRAHQMGKLSAAPSEKIFISRLDSSKRVCRNEIQLASFLEKEGFFVLVPSRHAYAEQISIVRNARVIVGLHGAGLANMLFAPKSCLVIEIFPENFLNTGYFALSQITGQPYFGFGHSSNCDPVSEKNRQPSQFEINLERFYDFFYKIMR